MRKTEEKSLLLVNLKTKSIFWFKKELYVKYRVTGKAWRSGKLFKEWIEFLN
jgi:hypothetical protein